MIIPVVLSGGAGSRLWPVSRESYPKPFMKISGEETLIGKTYQRAARVAEGGEIITVTNRDYYFLSKDEFERHREPNAPNAVFLLESVARNTAPAVTMAAFDVVERHGPDALLLVLPADHLIENLEAFGLAVTQAAELAKLDHLVTFGIVPTAPETGFGYIEAGDRICCGRTVIRFVEKPTVEVARSYLESGQFFWNSGMFCFKAGTLLDEMRHHAEAVFESSKICWTEMKQRYPDAGGMKEMPQDSFSKVPSVSIDYAVMEHSEKVAVVPADFDWNDIGSWSAVSTLYPPDQDDNRVIGEAILIETRNTFVSAGERLVATVGVEDLMIIDTADALLVARRDHAQSVKDVVHQLKLSDHEAFRVHRTVSRPWGTYTVLEEGLRFKIKRIEVRPGRSLSLQMHHHRSEHWVVVSGMARITNGESEIFVRTNESTYIPAGQKHRLENPGILDLVMIEVQSGEYLGEDDILRFEDAYGRFTGEEG